MTSLVADTRVVFSRELRPLLRDPFSVIFSMIQPLFFLALFAPLLPGDSSLQWFVPGIIVMSCLFGSSMTGSNLLFEMQTGSHERMLVTPLRRPALLIGRALKEIVPMLAQAALIVAVCIPFGFELHLAGALLGLIILAGGSASGWARCRTPSRWPRRTGTGCSGPCSRPCSSRCCCWPACCCRSRTGRAGCGLCRTPIR